MFNVYPDVLKELCITNCYITADEKNHWAKIIAVSLTNWMIVLDVLLEKANALFHIEYENEYLVFPVSCELHEGETYANTYIINFQSPMHNGLLKKIVHLEDVMNYLDKRKETRFSVGLANSEKLGLLKQYLFIGKNRYPCSIRDVSVHGMSLYSYPHHGKMIEKILKLQLELKNPSESIFMHGIPIRIETKTPEICLYSLHFYDPVPIQYKMRVANYSKIFT